MSRATDRAATEPVRQSVRGAPPRAVWWITVLTAISMTRLVVVFRLPSLEMFDGTNPDAWIGPWVSDTILGLLVPVVVYLASKGSGPRVWGGLIAYTVIGAFDYAHGLVTQWIHPQDANSAVTFGSIGCLMVLQTIVAVLLFRDDVVQHYLANDSSPAARSQS